MRILIDTREQRPLHFEPDEILTETDSATLLVGDYVAEFKDGSLCPIYFERKSLADLFGTLTSGHKRFKAELQLAKKMGFQLILAIEGTLTDVLTGPKYSSVSGIVIIRQIMTLWLKYGLTPIFFSSREEMARTIKEFYFSYGRNFKISHSKSDRGKT